MLSTKMNSAVLAKRIPTLLGLGVLVVGLIVGTIVFGQGTGVFSPRATPETTPKQVKVTNVGDRSFSVSFLTEESTTAFIKYGTDPDKLSLQAGDDRDQLYGTVKDYNLHHISTSSLEEHTTYYFVIGTDQGALYDDNGEPFSVLTAVSGGTPSGAKTIFGAATTAQGGPAIGSIIYAKLEGAGELSQLVQDSGSWAVTLAASRKEDGSGFANILETTPLTLLVQGFPLSLTASLNTTIEKFEMGYSFTLGAEGAGSSTIPATPTPTTILSPTPTATTSGTPTPTPLKEAMGSGGSLSELLAAQPTPSPTPEEVVKVDLNASGEQIVTTEQPLIIGNAPAGVVVNMKVNSDTKIEQQVTTNSQGQFSLDLAALGTQLEPGVHSVEYSYTDPTTGRLITETKTFTVANGTVQLAQANTTPSPTRSASPTATPTPVSYGTDYPYGTSPTPTTRPATGSAQASASATPTQPVSTRSGMPSTQSGVPVSGSVGTTLVLLFGGMFFLLSGAWSFWIAKEID